MSKKKTSKNNNNVDFDMQIFNDDEGNTSASDAGNDTTTPTTPAANSNDTISGSTTPLTSGGDGDSTIGGGDGQSTIGGGSGQQTIVGGGGSMEDGGDVDDDGGEDPVETKTFLETLIPGKTESEIIQETPMPAQTFDIAKTRPTLANQIKRANNAAKTTFNYLPY